MKSNRLRPFVRLVIIICGLSLIAAVFFPIWRIELNAPQYPEGLVLKIYADKLGGNLDIVNGLNHYIGMKTLHADDFVEFKVLPYIIGLLGLMGIVTGIINKKTWLYFYSVAFILFAIIAMIDFWKWEYNYGHNLDPTAPIQVPGMTYQPPLIGFKQLLNFGAYSIPDVGGWIFVGVGVALVICMYITAKTPAGNIRKMNTSSISKMEISLLVSVFLCSCNADPEPIKAGIDHCEFCKMTISDNRFGAEIITKKGKVFKFDDTHCLLSFHQSVIDKQDIKEVYFISFNNTHQLIKASEAYLLKSEALRTPMGGNVAAFTTQESIRDAKTTYNGEITDWKHLTQ